MRTRLPILAVLALASLAAAPVAGESAIVVVAEDGGFPPAAVRTVKSLAATELRGRGLDVREDPRFEGTVSLGPETLVTLAGAGASRVFVLRLGRLEQKVLITVEELAPPAATRVRADARRLEPRRGRHCGAAARSCGARPRAVREERAHADGDGAGVGAAPAQARRGAVRDRPRPRAARGRWAGATRPVAGAWEYWPRERTRAPRSSASTGPGCRTTATSRRTSEPAWASWARATTARATEPPWARSSRRVSSSSGCTA